MIKKELKWVFAIGFEELKESKLQRVYSNGKAIERKLEVSVNTENQVYLQFYFIDTVEYNHILDSIIISYRVDRKIVGICVYPEYSSEWYMNAVYLQKGGLPEELEKSLINIAIGKFMISEEWKLGKHMVLGGNEDPEQIYMNCFTKQYEFIMSLPGVLIK